ncbi:MAG: hypothetical protein ACPG51_19905 [Thiolinea sp.]
MDISTAYKQHQQVLNIQAQIAEVKREIKTVDFAYKVAFVGTFALYFCFIWGMYIADLWGFSTWLSANVSEVAALVVYGVLAIALPLAMALIKEIAYRHFSAYPNSKAIMFMVVGILAFAGVLYESITSSSQQQHISHSSAENSKSFDVIAGSQTTVDSGSMASLVAGAEAKLATCKKMVERGAYKDCDESNARLKGYLDAETRAMDSAEKAGVSAIEAKTKAMQELKEDSFKPVFKAIRDSMSVTIATAIMTVTIFVSAIFEISHLLLILLGGQKKQRLSGLEAALINMEVAYMQFTGKAFKPEDFSDDTVLDMADIREQSPSPIGFGSPAIAQFKYQEREQENRPFAGFVNTNNRTPSVNKIVSTWNNELSKSGINSPDDAAMNRHADQAQIQRIVKAGKSVQDCSEKVSEKVSTDRVHTVPNTFKQSADSLYPQWIQQLKRAELKPTVRPAREFISKQLCRETKSETLTPSLINVLAMDWFKRAESEGVILLNPDGGIGRPKYRLA